MGWSPHVPTELHVLRGTLDTFPDFNLLPTRLSLSMADFPKSFG